MSILKDIKEKFFGKKDDDVQPVGKSVDKPDGTSIQTGEHTLTMKDPNAMPTADELEAIETKKRMDRAEVELRWMDVSSGTIVEYSEEWHRILLLVVNGMSAMLKMSGTFMDTELREDGKNPVRTERNDDGTTSYVPVSSVGILMSGIDSQVRRLEAITAHLQKYPPLPLLIDKTEHRVSDEFVSRLGDVTQRLMFAIEGDLGGEVIACRNSLITGMEGCGFTFTTKRYPFVGEKYEFDTELHFVGRPVAPKKE